MLIKRYWILFLLFITHLSYAGEFGNYCLLSLSEGRFLKTDCSVNANYQGKEYCFGSEVSKEIFLKTPDEFIKKAAVFYEKNKEADRKKISQEDLLKEIKSPDCDFSNKDLGYLDMNGLDLSETNFKGANLTRARVIGTLGAVNMSGATIKYGQFGLDVGNQPMGQMKFDSVGGKFYKANFEGADLNIASFLFGDLREANLKNTNMYRADLGQADLTGADLTNADLTDANVDGAIFTNVKGLSTVKGFSTVKGKCRDCGMP
ncbi:MAG: pentapeptide repeat-containing protein [Betaproteobacteria bacterium]|nr:pentapeptide repeat-containing protein [Betaproteobacteria bacterium]